MLSKVDGSGSFPIEAEPDPDLETVCPARPVLAPKSPKPSGPGRNCQIEAHTQLQNCESFQKPRAPWPLLLQALAVPPCFAVGTL